jgi:lactate dehydrogenase-like 2-hydroxyacid dehydrogenase
MTELGIPVFNTPGANANAVKELVVCSLLLASRGILEGNQHVTNVIYKEENVSHRPRRCELMHHCDQHHGPPLPDAPPTSPAPLPACLPPSRLSFLFSPFSSCPLSFLLCLILPSALCLCRLQMNYEKVAKRIEKDKAKFVGTEIEGKTLGVVGLGAIGGLVVKAALSLGMKVIGFDPVLSLDAAWKLPGDRMTRAENLEQLLKVGGRGEGQGLGRRERRKRLRLEGHGRAEGKALCVGHA